MARETFCAAAAFPCKHHAPRGGERGDEPAKLHKREHQHALGSSSFVRTELELDININQVKSLEHLLCKYAAIVICWIVIIRAEITRRDSCLLRHFSRGPGVPPALGREHWSSLLTKPTHLSWLLGFM